MAAVNPTTRREREDRLIARALKLLELRLAGPAERFALDRAGSVHAYARLRLGELEREVFAVVFLDAGLRPIAIEQIFQGTLTSVSVHAREIARAALRHNAAGVVLIHNHPSGALEFSQADIAMTEDLRAAMRLIDVQVLDHVLIAGGCCASLATLERKRSDQERAHEAKQLDEERERHRAACKAAWARRRDRAKATA